MRPVCQLTTDEIETEFALGPDVVCGDRLDELEAELRARFGVTDAAIAVLK